MIGILIVWGIICLILIGVLIYAMIDVANKQSDLREELFGKDYERGRIQILEGEDRQRTEAFDKKIALLEKYLGIKITEEETRINGSIQKRFYGYKKVAGDCSPTNDYIICDKNASDRDFREFIKVLEKMAEGGHVVKISGDHKPEGAGNKKGRKR